LAPLFPKGAGATPEVLFDFLVACGLGRGDWRVVLPEVLSVVVWVNCCFFFILVLCIISQEHNRAFNTDSQKSLPFWPFQKKLTFCPKMW